MILSRRMNSPSNEAGMLGPCSFLETESASVQNFMAMEEANDNVDDISGIEPASFSSLPFELREQIWLYTFQPRLIYIHPHPIYPPEATDQYGRISTARNPRPRRQEIEPEITSLLFNYSVYSRDTTPAEAFAAYAKEVQITLESKGKWACNDGHEELSPDDIKVANPGPPVALNVCSESRAIAERKGFVLAFKGLEMKDGKCQLLERGFWVDFKRDIVMLDTTLRPAIIHCRAKPEQPLHLLMKYLPEDASRLKTIGLRGNLINVLMALQPFCDGPVDGGEEGEWQRLVGFPNLRAILVDDEFHLDSPGSSGVEVPSPLFLGNEQAVKEFLEARLTRDELAIRPPSWPWGIPSIKAIRGEAWKEYF